MWFEIVELASILCLCSTLSWLMTVSPLLLSASTSPAQQTSSLLSQYPLQNRDGDYETERKTLYTRL